MEGKIVTLEDLQKARASADKLAEAVWFRLLSRGSMVMVGLLSLPIYNNITDTFVKMQAQLAAQTTAIGNINAEHNLTKALLDLRLTGMGTRMNEIDERLRKIETDYYQPRMPK